jgi:plasmid stabilization system protein ParE
VKPVRFSDPAAEELAAAVRWYEQRRVGRGADFFDAVASTIELIRSHPEIGAEGRGRVVSRANSTFIDFLTRSCTECAATTSTSPRSRIRAGVPAIGRTVADGPGYSYVFRPRRRAHDRR